MKPVVIAITGGIGAGKSVVSRILRAMGFPVYDCDYEARRIMDSSPEILATISRDISSDVFFADGSLDRKALSAIVFSDSRALAALNGIVHGAVMADLKEKVMSASSCRLFFVETAILYESGLDALADEIWEVTAPEQERIVRVMARNAMSADEVKSRIAAQRQECTPTHKLIRNSSSDALLPQILTLINEHDKQFPIA